MLKKLVVIGAVASTMTMGAAGVAFAGDYGKDDDDKGHHKKKHDKGDDDSDSDSDDAGTDCSSHETTKQSNSGKQLIGGNVNLEAINGAIGGTLDKVAICPEIGNGNKFHY